MASRNAFSHRFHWSGYLLGFGLGGFFDGILLHQILQWHHLLSALGGDIRFQILADGLFHALMYVIATGGLWFLWRARHEFAGAGADRALFADALIGFGVWHVVDAVFSHWVTGIHRIRMDSPNPLVWDLIWFTAFGMVPLVIGLLMHRSGSGTVRRGPVAAVLIAAATIVGGGISVLPPPNVSQVVLYFRPGTTPQQVFAAAAAADARVLWADGSGELWAFDLAGTSRASSLYRHGALYVGNSLLPVGCLAWSRAI